MDLIAPPSTRTPHDPTSLVGREESLAALGGKLADGARLLTIVGPGGVGKTRLVQRLIERMMGAKGWQTAWFCDLSEAGAASDLGATVARLLDVVHSGARPSERPGDDVIARALRARGKILLVLDNFEQLPDEAAAMVDRWLRGAREVHIVVTSRRRLRLPGEHVFELTPLSLPRAGERDLEALRASPAVRLFVERAAMAGAEVDDEQLADVAAIVRELDGLPLAIELAAAKSRVLSPSAIRERLADRFGLLRDKAARSDRQATLRATLDWSWSHLTPTGQRALAACATFRGGWDLKAAVEVLAVGDELDTLDVLEELGDQSLLVVETVGGARRFRLYTTVRAYAAEHVALAPDARERHARHYARRAVELEADMRSARAREAFAAMALEIDNMLGAVQLASDTDAGMTEAMQTLVALAPVYERLGPIDVYAEQLALSLARGDVSPALRSRALVAQGRALEAMGKLVEAREVLEEALAGARRSGERAVVAEAATEVGWVAGTRGDYAVVDAAFEEADALCQELGDRWLEAHLRQKRGYLHYRRGERETAEADMRRALSLFRELGARREEAFALGWMGFIADGRTESAVPHFRRSVQMLEELGDVRHLARHLQYLAVFEVEDDRESAAEHFERALELHRQSGDRQQEAVTRARRSVLLLELGEARRALDDLSAALAALDGESDLLYRGETFVMVAAAEVDLGMTTAARHHLDQAEAVLAPLRYPCLDAIAVLRLRCDLADDRADGEAVRAVAAGEGIDMTYGLTRFAHRALLRAQTPDGAGARLLRIAHDASWFESAGERVELTRRAPMRRILEALATRAQSNSEPLSAAELIEAGWPGQDLLGTSGEARVYTTIRRLRKMGLEAHLLHDGAGYRLRGKVERVPSVG